MFDLAGHEDPETVRGPHGGIVYDIERVQVDDELVDLYLWVEPYRDGFRTGRIAGPDVRQWSPPNTASIRSLVRRLCRTVALSSGPLDSRDLEALELAWALIHPRREHP